MATQGVAPAVPARADDDHGRRAADKLDTNLDEAMEAAGPEAVCL